MSKFNVGDKVRYIGSSHEFVPERYPCVGTIGEIKSVQKWSSLVQWTKGSTSNNDRWYCSNKDMEIVENENMTNEEIWKMLKSKMRKNGLTSKVNVVKTNVDNYPDNEVEIIKAYYESDVHNAIAIAYRSGYERAIKGRPFKFGEKKKKSGHWKPVDPNNLPKEGTKVKLKKEYCNYYGGVVESGEIGIVFHDASYSSRVNGYGVDFGEYKTIWFPLNRTVIADCLDMWVEDDE